MQRPTTRWTAELSLLEFGAAQPDTKDDDRLVGVSGPGERLRRKATALATAGFSMVAISGPPGSGKLHMARWLHQRGPRGAQPLACLDAASDPTASGLTALTRATPGNIAVKRLERASQDLLAALGELAARNAGQADRGLFLLTSRPVAELRARSLFFEQLLGHPSGALLEIPPLGSRPGDASVLARGFVDDAASRYQKSVRGLSARAAARLEQHPFPGNIRELAAIVERAVLRSTGDWVTVDDLGLEAPDATAADDGTAQLTIRLPGSSLRDIELRAIKLALKLADGRLVRAAELLGVTRHALRRKLEKFGIEDLRTRPARLAAHAEPVDDDGYI